MCVAGFCMWQHGSPPEWENQSAFALIVFKQNILNRLNELLRT